MMDKFRMLAPVSHSEEAAAPARSVRKMAQRMRKQFHARLGSLQLQDPSVRQISRRRLKECVCVCVCVCV